MIYMQSQKTVPLKFERSHLIICWNNSPTGAFDHVTINENLDRVADYSLWDMTQTDCGEFEVSQTASNYYNRSSPFW